MPVPLCIHSCYQQHQSKHGIKSHCVGRSHIHQRSSCSEILEEKAAGGYLERVRSRRISIVRGSGGFRIWRSPKIWGRTLNQRKRRRRTNQRIHQRDIGRLRTRSFRNHRRIMKFFGQSGGTTVVEPYATGDIALLDTGSHDGFLPCDGNTISNIALPSLAAKLQPAPETMTVSGTSTTFPTINPNRLNNIVNVGYGSFLYANASANSV